MAFGRAAETERLHAAERYVAQMNCQCGLTKIRLFGRLIHEQRLMMWFHNHLSIECGVL